MSALRASGSVWVWVWVRKEAVGVVEVHPGVAGQLQSGDQADAGLLGLTGGDHQPPKDRAKEGAIGVHPQRAQRVEESCHGGTMTRTSVRVHMGIRRLRRAGRAQ